MPSPLVLLFSQLQKSAVLQKTIDYIRHLENMVRRLTEENEQLKEVLANSELTLALSGCDGIVSVQFFVRVCIILFGMYM